MNARRLDAADLKDLTEASARVAPVENCVCRLKAARGWESNPDERWPAALMEFLGTLRDVSVEEPTFEEFHPEGTRYGSPEAPIAVQFFPFNRSDLFRCRRCSMLVLRYTEYGGYFVDHRVRCITSAAHIV